MPYHFKIKLIELNNFRTRKKRIRESYKTLYDDILEGAEIYSDVQENREQKGKALAYKLLNSSAKKGDLAMRKELLARA